MKREREVTVANDMAERLKYFDETVADLRKSLEKNTPGIYHLGLLERKEDRFTMHGGYFLNQINTETLAMAVGPTVDNMVMSFAKAAEANPYIFWGIVAHIVAKALPDDDEGDESGEN